MYLHAQRILSLRMGDANFATLTAPPVLDPDLINAPLALPIVLSSLMGGVCRHVARRNFSIRPRQNVRTVMQVVRAVPELDLPVV